MYSGGQRIRPHKRIESRQCASVGRQQSCLRQGEQAGHHRGLRAGHVFKGVTRELGRASRLLGSNRRSKGDRHNQHPGVQWSALPLDEPTPVQAGRDTKRAFTQGTGREPKANRPGRAKAVVATHSTAGQGATSVRTRGEPRPKGPTIEPQGSGKAMPGMTSVLGKGRRDIEPITCLHATGMDCEKVPMQGDCKGMGSKSHAPAGW